MSLSTSACVGWNEVLIPPSPCFERGPGWDKARDEHLLVEPVCQLCGCDHGLEVHHKYPVHFPGGEKLELVPANLITLCRVHHFIFGHLGDWLARNPTVEADCREWRLRYRDREYAA